MKIRNFWSIIYPWRRVEEKRPAFWYRQPIWLLVRYQHNTWEVIDSYTHIPPKETLILGDVVVRYNPESVSTLVDLQPTWKVEVLDG